MDNAEKYELKDEWLRDYGISGVFDEMQDYLYHYTTRENLWNIIGSDSMYARNIRFSNDSEEYTIGKKEVEEIAKIKISNVDDCYMICFCEKDDILSQWREYARGGVSIMMDFKEDIFYTLKVNKELEEENKKKRQDKLNNAYYIPQRKLRNVTSYEQIYARPIKVKYIEPGKKEIKKEIKKIKKAAKGDEEMKAEKYLKTLIPYIKHKGFHEEEEVRLIFKINAKTAPSLVGYLNDEGMRRPYIRVEMGDASQKELQECVVKYYHIPSELQEDIYKTLKDGKLVITILNEKGETQEEIIDIEFKEEKQERIPNEIGHIYIGNCKYQEYIFDFFDHFVSCENVNRDEKINIWCEGHLPIRKITVGPSSDKGELRESIAHRIKNVYWMKYVQVETSNIPYRSKQGDK